LELQIINPLTFPDWDQLLLKTEGYSFFHSSAWAKVLNETYGYTPLYFTIIENGGFSALLPVMEVNSFLKGKRGVSLPFSDYCEPIIPDRVLFQEIVNLIKNYGKERGWKYVEFRGAQDFLGGETPSESYFGHTLDLTKDIHKIFSDFRGSTRRNIRKAEREGVEVGIFKSPDSIREFYHLNCITRKHHGLPIQPYSFFKNIFKHIISQNLGFVVLASYNNKIIAGAAFFHYGENAFFKYGASDRRFQHLRPNNLVMWEAIKWYANNGYKSFCFGRTEPENKGLLQFKKGWGIEQKIIKYYTHDLKKGVFLKNSHNLNLSAFQKKVFSKMPVSLLKFFGLLFYKQTG